MSTKYTVAITSPSGYTINVTRQTISAIQVGVQGIQGPPGSATDVSGLQAATAALTAAVISLQSATASLQGGLSGFEATTTAQIAGLQSGTATNASKISSLESATVGLASNVATLQSSVTSLQSATASLKNSLTSGYVPYTGAISGTDLGSQSITSLKATIKGDSNFGVRFDSNHGTPDVRNWAIVGSRNFYGDLAIMQGSSSGSDPILGNERMSFDLSGNANFAKGLSANAVTAAAMSAQTISAGFFSGDGSTLRNLPSGGSTGGLVPYSGATADVNLASFSLTATSISSASMTAGSITAVLSPRDVGTVTQGPGSIAIKDGNLWMRGTTGGSGGASQIAYYLEDHNRNTKIVIYDAGPSNATKQGVDLYNAVTTASEIWIKSSLTAPSAKVTTLNFNDGTSQNTAGSVSGKNIGGGFGLFVLNESGTGVFRSISAAGGITITQSGSGIEIGSTTSSGEANTATNLVTTGSGTAGTFAQKVGVQLQFKSLIAGSNIGITESASAITISGNAGGGGGGLPYPTGATAGVNLQTYGLTAASISTALFTAYNSDSTQYVLNSHGRPSITADIILDAVRISTNPDAPVMFPKKARGSEGALVPVQPDDELWALHGQGWDGSSWNTGARIQMKVDGVTGSGSIPGRIELISFSGATSNTVLIVSVRGVSVSGALTANGLTSTSVSSLGITGTTLSSNIVYLGSTSAQTLYSPLSISGVSISGGTIVGSSISAYSTLSAGGFQTIGSLSAGGISGNQVQVNILTALSSVSANGGISGGNAAFVNVWTLGSVSATQGISGANALFLSVSSLGGISGSQVKVNILNALSSISATQGISGSNAQFLNAWAWGSVSATQGVSGANALFLSISSLGGISGNQVGVNILTALSSVSANNGISGANAAFVNVQALNSISGITISSGTAATSKIVFGDATTQITATTGERNTITNLIASGSATGNIYAQKVGDAFQMKAIVAGANLGLTEFADRLVLSGGAGGAGETNTLASLGSGVSITSVKVGTELRIYTLSAGSNIGITRTDSISAVTISAASFTGGAVASAYWVTMVDGGTAALSAITVNFNQSNVWKFVVTGTTTTATLAGGSAGGRYLAIVGQGGTTGSVLFAPSSAIKWLSGTAPGLSTSAGTTDLVTFVSDGTTYYGSYGSSNTAQNIYYGVNPSWFGKLYTNFGDCNPAELDVIQSFTHGSNSSTAGPSPSQIGAGLARLQAFTPPQDMTVKAVRYYMAPISGAVAAYNGAFSMAVYHQSSSAAIWRSGPGSISAVSNSSWVMNTSGCSFYLTGGQNYWFGLGSSAAVITISPWRSLLPPVSGFQLATMPGSLSTMAIHYAQMTITNGVFPATLSGLANPAWINTGNPNTGTLPLAFFDSVSTV